MIIFGITGTLGSGKGTIVSYLKEKGFEHFSVRAFITEEVERRGLPVNRDTLVAVANDLRAKHSPSYIAEQLYARAAKLGKNCVIESIRTLGEVNSLRARENFHLLAVDADREVRYARITARATETDKITFEKFLADDEREMTSNDPNKQNLSACIAAADPRFRFMNNGALEELRAKLNEALAAIL